MYGGGKKQSEENIIKSTSNFFKLEKENEAIKDRAVRDIGILFKQGNDYYKPRRIGIIWNNNYIKYESSGDRNKNLSVKEHLNKIKPYSRDKTINLQQLDAWKIKLRIAIC